MTIGNHAKGLQANIFMPNCFQLFRKNDPEQKPQVFQQIDEEMCKHFNVPCDDLKYHHGWYDIIGFQLAMGVSFEKQKERSMGDILTAKSTVEMEWEKHHYDIIEWLDQNFTSDAWAEIGRL